MSSETPPRAGRPIDESKRRAVLDAARAAFFAHGFEGTRIEDIAESAGVSKVTVYNRFGDKAALLTECVRAQCEAMQAEMGLDRMDDRDLETLLNDCGTTLLSFLLSENHIGFDRVMAAEGVRNPELGRQFFEAGPARMHAALASVLEKAAGEGAIVLDNARAAAEHLVGMWRGMADVRMRFGREGAPDSHAIRQKVEEGTARFLKAYR